MLNLVYEWVNFSKFSHIWVKIWPKFKKIFEKSGNSAQNLAQNRSDWYMNGSLFLQKLLFVWFYIQIMRRSICTKTKLSIHPPRQGDLPSSNNETICYFHVLFSDDKNKHFFQTNLNVSAKFTCSLQETMLFSFIHPFCFQILLLSRIKGACLIFIYLFFFFRIKSDTLLKE